MKNLTRIIQGSAIVGFLLFSSGCIIAPEHDQDHDRDREDHEHHARHCDDRDDHCREH